MRFDITKFINENFRAGIRNIGVGIALAGALALFFEEGFLFATLVFLAGLVVLFFASFTE